MGLRVAAFKHATRRFQSWLSMQLAKSCE